MKLFTIATGKVRAVSVMRKAALSGTFDGTDASSAYMAKCTGMYACHESKSIAVMIFTRDDHHHSSGFFKNPQYEKCWHLSLSFREMETNKTIPSTKELSEPWVDLFFGSMKKYIWVESPFSEEGKESDTYHYRVFTDEHWKPIVPKGEVYNTHLTSLGWKSFSEVSYEKAKKEKEIYEA
jgi:hypothetical protein